MSCSLFFALWPSPVVRARMSAMAAQALGRHQGGGRPLDPARYHLTMAFLGRFMHVSPDQVDACIQAAGQVRAQRFALDVDRTGCFGSRIGWLGCSVSPPGLGTLHARLHEQLAEHALLPSAETPRFVPHVTILRHARKPLAEAALEATRWDVDAFALMRSAVDTEIGYRVLEMFPLESSP